MRYVNEIDWKIISGSLSFCFTVDALDVIVEYMNEKVNSENCLCFRKLGLLHSLTELVSRSDEFIVSHFEEMSKQEAFFDLSADELDKILASDTLKVCAMRNIYFQP